MPTAAHYQKHRDQYLSAGRQRYAEQARNPEWMEQRAERARAWRRERKEKKDA